VRGRKRGEGVKEGEGEEERGGREEREVKNKREGQGVVSGRRKKGREKGINHYSLRKITHQRTHHKHLHTLLTVVLS